MQCRICKAESNQTPCEKCLQNARDTFQDSLDRIRAREKAKEEAKKANGR